MEGSSGDFRKKLGFRAQGAVLIDSSVLIVTPDLDRRTLPGVASGFLLFISSEPIAPVLWDLQSGVVFVTGSSSEVELSSVVGGVVKPEVASIWGVSGGVEEVDRSAQ